ncbi:LuxR C-terminal-related transcriptional regulator [Streptacidiphilus sp. P02-A3a]|uniref:LuxR C-terminal-related transcriptional regulator n=1 Tax=Streptacidiphilus sp. P02-A3a TaxID=2704468 RepID=UPI0015FB1FA5|nr:LuxR C-terminal-related transcriptional regulator [Streptacidiphilus sp. P02-A3a]QMU73401.1 LuxR family transcriptional regulator [Streptacidiphilus sp. P02-A3a]
MSREDVPPCLMALHLAVESEDSPSIVYPVPPAIAADRALRPLESAIDGLRRTAESIRSSFSGYEELYAEARSNEKPELTLIHGSDAISAALDLAVSSCRRDLITAQPGGGRSPELLTEALERVLPILERKVRQRTLYQHTVRSHQPTMAYIERVTGAGAEVRTLAEVFDRMIICDQEVAYIPVSEQTATAALEVRHPALVRYLTVVFERSWSRATPVGESGAPGHRSLVIDDLQRTILLAVVAGETDERIGRRLGMSRRSVVEHVRRVSEQMGSGSRAQLGYLLRDSGILDLPE